jgi:nucleoid DNA-binding protein
MANIAGEQHVKERTVTKADLIEEVTRVTELPRKDSELVVETIFDSIIAALQTSDKIEIRGFGSFRVADAPDAIRKPARKWKCRRKEFRSSSRARN